jgi:hypothetical protein
LAPWTVEDRTQCADPKLVVIRDGNGGGTFVLNALHDNVAPALAHAAESVQFEYGAHLGTGQDAELT